MEITPGWGHRWDHGARASTIMLSGELDVACAPSLQALLFDQVRNAPGCEVRVDLAGVTFLDSTTLGVLISGYHNADAQGGRLTVVNPSEPAQRILMLTGLHDVLSP